MASLETTGIIQFLLKTGLPHKVTSIDDGTHAKNSYHYAQGTPGDGLTGRGLAVDFAGTSPNDEQQMTVIYAAFMTKAPQLAELIHNGPATAKAVKDGMVVSGPVAYGPVTWAAHQNHVHVAVKKGVFLAPPPEQHQEVHPVYDPPLQIVDFLGYLHGSGGWGLGPDGGIFAFGDAPYRGPDKQPYPHDYWGDRKAAKLERNGDGYDVVATTGERYAYP